MNPQIENLFLAQAAGSPSVVMQFAPFALILVVFYFFLIRPQQKRMKQHQDMINNVKRGDSITTSGGIVGKVTKVTDAPEIEVEIAPEVRVKVVRAMISEVKIKGEPANNA